MYSYIYSVIRATASLRGGGSENKLTCLLREQKNSLNVGGSSRLYFTWWWFYLGKVFTAKSGKSGCVLEGVKFRWTRVWGGEAKEWRSNEEQTAGPVLRSHLNGLCCCVFGAGAVGTLWQRVGGTAAPDAVWGADTRGRVGPGANQPGHTSCGHCGNRNVLEEPGSCCHRLTSEWWFESSTLRLSRLKSNDGESEGLFTLQTNMLLRFWTAEPKDQKLENVKLMHQSWICDSGLFWAAVMCPFVWQSFTLDRRDKAEAAAISPVVTAAGSTLDSAGTTLTTTNSTFLVFGLTLTGSVF